MNNIWIMVQYTLREALAKKVFIFFAGFTLLMLILLAVILGVSSTDMILPALQDHPEKMKELISAFQVAISGSLGGILIFLSIFSCANFISAMLEKGTVDLFLSKPISRAQLLWGKFAGGCIVFLMNILVPVIGSWLIISLKFNLFNFSFLWIIVTYFLTFAVLYSIVIFLGVLTRSSIPGLMTAYFIYIFLSYILNLGKTYAEQISSSSIIQGIIKGLYYVIPKTSELMGVITNDLIIGRGVADFQPVITTFLFLILMMSSGFYFFRKKDF